MVRDVEFRFGDGGRGTVFVVLLRFGVCGCLFYVGVRAWRVGVFGAKSWVLRIIASAFMLAGVCVGVCIASLSHPPVRFSPLYIWVFEASSLLSPLFFPGDSTPARREQDLVVLAKKSNDSALQNAQSRQ